MWVWARLELWVCGLCSSGYVGLGRSGYLDLWALFIWVSGSGLVWVCGCIDLGEFDGSEAEGLHGCVGAGLIEHLLERVDA
jgi:hypothetical protein